jgi:hypothetical protein
MSKEAKKVEIQRINEKAFDDYRNLINMEFTRTKLFYKQRLTQGLCWVDIENNIANQYFREEAWLFGFKTRDNLKLIDHMIVDENSKRKGSVGFIN